VTGTPVSQTLGDLLSIRGLLAPGTRAVRHTLHPEDRSADVPSLDYLVANNLLPVYERMQDGRRLGHETTLLSFRAEPGGRARLLGHRRVFAREKAWFRATSSMTTTPPLSCTPSSPGRAARPSTTQSTRTVSMISSVTSSYAGRRRCSATFLGRTTPD
jgi:hypothetical protein